MIKNDNELQVAQERILQFQKQVSHLRRIEADPRAYHSSAAGFLAEIDRMQLEIREYLMIHPAELSAA